MARVKLSFDEATKERAFPLPPNFMDKDFFSNLGLGGDFDGYDEEEEDDDNDDDF